jgi:hypothetical protein
MKTEPDRDFAADLALCEAARPGPWLFEGREGSHVGVSCPSGDVYGYLHDPDTQDFVDAQVVADWRFIAAAREGWPAAIREVLQLRAVVDGYAAGFDTQHEEIERLRALHAHACERIVGQSDQLSRTAEGRAVALLDKLRRLDGSRHGRPVAFDYEGADGNVDRFRVVVERIFHADANPAHGKGPRWLLEGVEEGALRGIPRVFAVDAITLLEDTE